MTYTLEQIKENRRKWVEALRSGKYQQGQNWLRNKDDKFCCLGVLADLAGCKWSRCKGERYFRANYSASTSSPIEAQEFVGLGGGLGPYKTHMSLAEDNDGGASFAQIAALIESEPEGLFIPDEELRSAS